MAQIVKLGVEITCAHESRATFLKVKQVEPLKKHVFALDIVILETAQSGRIGVAHVEGDSITLKHVNDSYVEPDIIYSPHEGHRIRVEVYYNGSLCDWGGVTFEFRQGSYIITSAV